MRSFAFAIGPILFVAALAQPARAQENWDRYQAHAILTEQAPEIDGSIDEPAWQRAEVITDFIQQEPNEGASVSERTELRILYDQENLYLAVHAYDAEPAGVLATEMRRDSDRILEEDNFQIILDTFQDSRSAYMFVTNPLGAKLEQQVFEEGEGGRRGTSSNVNRDWDGVWDVSARRVPDGWVAEIAIPVVTLRFPAAASQEWGINFMRNIGRKNEQSYWAPITKGYSITRVSLAGSLAGMESLNRGRDIRIKPFVVTGGSSIRNGGPAENSMERDIGVDLKYGITPGLNLDLTLNTDFAQAEIDDEQVNLTRFALYFPEKRDFFLENAGQFNVGSTNSNNRLADLFFSRRIGLSETGAPVPIIGGARITGKLGPNNIAIMEVQTDDAFGRPGENFLVSRYSRDIFGRSKVGALLINKQAIEGAHYNRTYAADMMLAPNPYLTINGFIARTDSPGEQDEGEIGGHLRAGWLSQSWRIYGEYTDIDADFNAEVGFIPRRGIRMSKLHFEHNPRPGILGIRSMEPMTNVTITTDQDGKLLTRQFHNMVGTRFENGAFLNVWYNHWFERLETPFAIRPDIVIPAGDYNFGDWMFSFTSNPSKRFYYRASLAPQGFYGGDRLDTNFSTGLRLTSRLAAEAGFSRNDVDLPAGDFVANVGSMRVDFALSPNMNVRSLTQYNSLTEQWSNSARFHYIYRPGSDFYIVYTELNRDLPTATQFRDRRLLLKLTYLVSR